MSLPFLQINAFASVPFTGNPAAVVLLERPMPEPWLQNVAREFNLSETAFLLARFPRPASIREASEWNLRWFTPAVEVDLCGHATLAAAHALREWNLVPDDWLRFHTRSGVLPARFVDGDIALDFPATPPEPIEMPHGLPQVLGIAREDVLWCGRSRFDIVLQLASARLVESLQPDFEALKKFEARGVAVTASGEGHGCDFVSRFFAPGVGVDEDPVTGSAHCALAPFWEPRLNKSAFVARQMSERGGELKAQVLGNRVELRGAGVTILRGEVLPSN